MQSPPLSFSTRLGSKGANSPWDRFWVRVAIFYVYKGSNSEYPQLTRTSILNI
jgi:hypothetical protein